MKMSPLSRELIDSSLVSLQEGKIESWQCTEAISRVVNYEMYRGYQAGKAGVDIKKGNIEISIMEEVLVDETQKLMEASHG